MSAGCRVSNLLHARWEKRASALTRCKVSLPTPLDRTTQATAGPSIAGQTPVSNLPTTDHMACVLVSGLAWSATGKSIKAHFGEAEPTQVLFQPVNDINKAVVAFRTAAAATAALSLHGSVLQGNTLRVRLCSAPKSLKR